MTTSTTTTASPNFPKASDKQLAAEGRRYFTFFNLSLALVGITFFELILIILPFPKPLLLTALVFLSLAKFVGVVWYFMHLRWDRLFLTLLFMLGLTLAGGTVAALLFLIGAEEQIPPLERAAMQEAGELP